VKVVGVDLGTRKAAVAILVDGALDTVDAFVAREGLPRHEQLRLVSDYVFDVCEAVEPDYVFIEEALVGNNRNYSLMIAQCLGAVAAELSVLNADFGTEIIFSNNKKWKRRVIGNGNASKEMIKIWVEGQHPAYAMQCANDQDRLDALCIAIDGHRVVEQSAHLNLSD
jgi:Holliday junction resolvasome RuvABC endonuclease subunit